MSQIEIKGVALDIDMEDADFQEKYQNAFDKLEITEKTLTKDGKAADITRAYCHMFDKLFDDIFGSGTAENMFHGKCKSSEHEEAYMEFISECSKQVKDITARRSSFLSKYTPNRSTRRSLGK